MGSALVITTDGVIAELEMPKPGPHLKFMYRAMGCELVEVVALRPGLDMWLDEEGMRNDSVNMLATSLARLFGRRRQPYYGTALLAGRRGADAVGLDEKAVTRIRWLLGQLTAGLQELDQ